MYMTLIALYLASLFYFHNLLRGWYYYCITGGFLWFMLITLEDSILVCFLL